MILPNVILIQSHSKLIGHNSVFGELLRGNNFVNIYSSKILRLLFTLSRINRKNKVSEYSHLNSMQTLLKKLRPPIWC